MRIEIVTLFPEMVHNAAQYGVTGRALDRGLWMLACRNPRDFADDAYRSVLENAVPVLREATRLDFFQRLGRQHAQVFPMRIVASNAHTRGVAESRVVDWLAARGASPNKPKRRWWQRRN